MPFRQPHYAFRAAIAASFLPFRFQLAPPATLIFAAIFAIMPPLRHYASAIAEGFIFAPYYFR